MCFRSLAVFAAFMFCLALAAPQPAAACDPGVAPAPGNPTFSLVQPQAVYQPQAFVTQQFVHQPQVQAFAVHHPQRFAAVNVQPQAFAVRQPRRQVQRQVIVNRGGGVLGFRAPVAAVGVGY